MRLLSGKGSTLYLIPRLFDTSASEDVKKHYEEKKQVLNTSKFSFSHHIFNFVKKPNIFQPLFKD